MTQDPPRANCADTYAPFDALTDGPRAGHPHAARLVADLCVGCALRDGCWADNADETWLVALKAEMRRVMA